MQHICICFALENAKQFEIIVRARIVYLYILCYESSI